MTYSEYLKKCKEMALKEIQLGFKIDMVCYALFENIKSINDSHWFDVWINKIHYLLYNECPLRMDKRIKRTIRSIYFHAHPDADKEIK